MVWHKVLGSALVAVVGIGSAWAWELANPDQPTRGAVSTTRVVDVMLVVGRRNSERVRDNAHYIAFADPVGDACRMSRNVAPDEENEIRRWAGSYQGRYAILSDPRMVPIALFARAHNQTVRVKVASSGQDPGDCVVVWFQTCADPNNCAIPPGD